MAKVGRSNRRLREQLERSVPAVGLNLAEGWARTGGNERQRFETAIGEARETMMALELASALGYLEPSETAEAVDCLDKIIAMTFKLSRSRPRRAS
jgi:four helix bundle protein